MSKITDIRNHSGYTPSVNPNAEMRAKLRVGMSVSFNNGNGGETTDAVVVKINKKNIKVRTVQARRNAPAGAMWNVSPSLLTIREGADFQPPTEKELALNKIEMLMQNNGISLKDVAAIVKGTR